MPATSTHQQRIRLEPQLGQPPKETAVAYRTQRLSAAAFKGLVETAPHGCTSIHDEDKDPENAKSESNMDAQYLDHATSRNSRGTCGFRGG